MDNTAHACPHISFDHNEPDHRASAEQVWRDLRSKAGIPHTAAHGGFFVLTRYADVTAAALDWATFSSAEGIAVPDLHFDQRLVPIEYDPPELRSFRRLVMPLLTPLVIAQHEQMVRAAAESLAASLPKSGRIDFVDAFARPFPTAVALQFFGFPATDAALLDELINLAIGGRGDAESRAAAEKLDAYIAEFVASRRRASLDSGNIIDVIVHNGGELLTPAQQQSFVKLLLFGGFTTTTFALSSFIAWIAKHPADRDRLAANPDLMKTAADEIVRFSSPGTYLGRTTTCAVDVSGTAVPSRAKVVLSYGSANRDPDQFERPDELVFDRVPNPHLGFGMGPHRCIGVHLAKLELTVAIEVLLETLPPFRLDPTEEIQWMSGETQGMTCLPLVLGGGVADTVASDGS